VTTRFARPLAALALAAGTVVLLPGTSQALPTEHVTITLTVNDANYGATATVTSADNPSEKFDINIVRVSNVLVRTGGCTNTNTCTIQPVASAGGPAVFEVHVIGGQRTLFDNVFDVFTLTTVCVDPSTCVSTPTLISNPV
jgi:hypothetical protein